MDIYGMHSLKIKLWRRFRYFYLRLLRSIRRFKLRRSWHRALIAVIVLPVLMLYGCDKLTVASKAKPVSKIPVLAATVVAKNMPIYISALGSVTPINSVTVKTQIDGQLLKVHFKDGQIVNAGDLLAEIDPRPYQALLLQYQGQLARDKALLANAIIDLQRYKTLFAQDSISQQTLATQAGLVDQYRGDIKSDQGQIEAVKVNLNYCRIIAPITGRLGLITVDPGNIVHTSDTTGIVVLNTMDPIYVDFAIAEDDLPTVALKMASGEQLTVYAQDRTQNITLATGFLLTTDNQINTTTGTIMLRAQFINEKNILFPNQFVNVKLLLDELQQAVVVPTAAVQYGANGTYVYLLKDDNTVMLKAVTIAATVDGETAIVADVKPGQQVITEGTDRLKEGSEVTILQALNIKNGESSDEPI